jgi:hypothetical protein
MSKHEAHGPFLVKDRRLEASHLAWKLTKWVEKSHQFYNSPKLVMSQDMLQQCYQERTTCHAGTYAIVSSIKCLCVSKIENYYFSTKHKVGVVSIPTNRALCPTHANLFKQEV